MQLLEIEAIFFVFFFSLSSKILIRFREEDSDIFLYQTPQSFDEMQLPPFETTIFIYIRGLEL